MTATDSVPLALVLWTAGVIVTLGLIVLAWVSYEIRELRKSVAPVGGLVEIVERMERQQGMHEHELKEHALKLAALEAKR